MPSAKSAIQTKKHGAEGKGHRVEGIGQRAEGRGHGADSILTFTLSTSLYSGLADPQQPLHGKTLIYGKNSGLISFPIGLNTLTPSTLTSDLLYSNQLNFGNLPQVPEEIFNYAQGNEYHSIVAYGSKSRRDTSFIRRVVLFVTKTGNLLQHIDSVYSATY